jgi:hypothetical protein
MGRKNNMDFFDDHFHEDYEDLQKRINEQSFHMIKNLHDPFHVRMTIDDNGIKVEQRHSYMMNQYAPELMEKLK